MTALSWAISWRIYWSRKRCWCELKAVKALDNVHMAQCLNYLKATGLGVCLLLNFGEPMLKIKRVVL